MVMMYEDEFDLHGAAARWHSEIDAPYMDWVAFEAWLLIDPRHRTAYDEIASLDAEIIEDRNAIASRLPIRAFTHLDPAPARRSTRVAVAASLAAVAAAVVAVIGGGGKLHRDPQDRVIVVASGPTGRSLDLADGSRIRLDRNTRIAIASGKATVIDMVGGMANFRIRHDPSRPVTIHADGYEVRDVGTVFDVAALPQHLTVAVAEGSVGLRRSGADAGDEIMIHGGQRIDLDPKTGTLLRSAVAPQSVSAWQKGQLSYDDAPLSMVGADVSRYLDRPLVIDRSAADIRFSGVLTIGDGSRLVDQLAAVLPINARRIGGVVHFRRAGIR